MSSTLTPADRRWARDLVHLKRGESNYVRPANVPPRDYVYDDDTTNLGLPGNRMKYRDLTKDEIGTDEVDSRILKTTGDAASGERAVINAALNNNVADRRVIANNAIGEDQADADFLKAKHFAGSGPARLPTGVIVRGGSDIDGEISAVHLPNLGGMGGSLPVDKLPDNIPPTKLPEVNALRGKVNRTNLEDFLNGDRLVKPGTLPLGALNGAPWENKTTEPQVRDIVRSMVKATSLK